MLSDACQVLKRSYDKGWISTRDGNVSVRTSSTSFFISPSGARKFSLSPDDFLEVHLAQGAIDSLEAPHLGAKPSGELDLHKLVQDLLPPDKHVVLHLHPTYIVAAMYAGFTLANIAESFPEVSRYTSVGTDVPALPATSGELAVATAQVFAAQLPALPHIVGLDRHGVVAIGRDAWECFEHVERLEHICQIVLSAAASGCLATELLMYGELGAQPGQAPGCGHSAFGSGAKPKVTRRSLAPRRR